MRFLFHNDAPFNKLNLYVLDTWTCLGRGEGEEEIANHGRSRVESFSQETEAIGQQSHGVTKLSRSYTLQSQVQDARDSRTLTPLFSSFNLQMDLFDKTEKVSAAAGTFSFGQSSLVSVSSFVWRF